MARKIFISFLGTSNYSETRYRYSGELLKTIVSTRFVQESSVKTFCQEFNEDDRVVILTTSEALKNWKDGEHFNRDTKESEFHYGLHTKLIGLDLLCKVKNIHVPNGNSKEEIWEIFKIIYDLFEENDEVYFDITHGFRSLPLLNLVLINYAKLLKGISVKGIYYGAWEARTKEDNIEFAPLWDLTDFAKLQEWTNNANIFLKTGNANGLVDQITSEAYSTIQEKLKAFSEFNLGNRGMNIYDGQVMIDLRNELGKDIETDDPAFSALKPILEKIKEEFSLYKKESVINGFLSVKWCIENGLIQQAFTMLEESITTFVMGELGEIEFISDHKKRTSVSATITLGNLDEFRFDDEDELLKQWQIQFISKIKDFSHRKKLKDLSNKIKNSARNDLNHAGFRLSPRSFAEFKKSAIKRYKETKKLIKQIKKIDLPDLKSSF